MTLFVRNKIVLVLYCVIAATLPQISFAQGNAPQTQRASALSQSVLIMPETLVHILKSGKNKPLILNVGPQVIYAQAHIPGAEYVGAGSEPEGIEQLRARVKSLRHSTAIVLYCGCCPWTHCPNAYPAYAELHKLGFTNVKVLYIADNFGADWVYKGYPTVMEKQ